MRAATRNVVAAGLGGAMALVLALSHAAGAEEGWIDLVIDPDATFEQPDLPRPGYLETVVDPAFGTRVTRITGDPGTPIPGLPGARWGEVARHHYSKDQPWNADGSLIHLTRNRGGTPGSVFLDGETYRVLFARDVPGEHRWHPTEPDVKIYVSGTRVGRFDVRTGGETVLREFAGCTKLALGPWEGNLSHDGRVVALVATRPDGGREVFAYDIAGDVGHAPLDLGAARIDWASVSASGRYVVVMYGDADTRVYDIDMKPVSRFTVNHNHYDLGLDGAGEDVAVGVSKRSAHDGRVVMHRLRDAAFTRLTRGGYAGHTSMRNVLLPGWAYSSMSASERWPPFRGEIVAVRTDGSGQVRRLCHMRNAGTDYLSEAQSCPSPDGRRVVFASTWGSRGRPVGCYVVDARAPGSRGGRAGDGERAERP